MDKRTDPDPLVGWGLAAFHAATLVVVLVTLLYLSVPIGELFAGLQTSVGLALYLALWTITWWTNHHWLRGTRITRITMGDASNGRGGVIWTSFKWGGITGSGFFVAVVILAVIPQIVPDLLDVVPFVLLLTLVGVIVAFVLGGIVGTVFAFADLVLLQVAERIVSVNECSRDSLRG